MIFTNNTGNNLPTKNLPPTQGATSYQLLAIKKLKAISYKLKADKGFTLIELLVVVGIIGVVTGIVMSSINNAKAKGRDAKRIADISVIQLALERYYDDTANKKYPTSLNSLDSSVPKTDPSGNNYSYKALTGDNNAACSATACQSYHLGTTLELYNGILSDDADLNSGVSGDFNGTDNTTSTFIYDVIPKF